MDNIIEKCPEGGEGHLIEQETYLPDNVVRCSCISCKAQECKRLKAYLRESVNPNNKNSYAEFCGEVFTNPRKDCNYFI
jgi:hypothetical protein